MEQKAPKPRELSLDTVLRIISCRTRWQILDALLTTEAMVPIDLAKALSLHVDNVSKHLVLMKRLGVIEQRIGRAYSVNPRYRVPGERALEFGAALIRLDRLSKR